MTTFYVRQSDGADADDGLTWANAKATLAGALSAAAAGDIIYVDKVTANTVATTTTHTIAGTAANPIKIVSVNSTGNPQPPTASESGASSETSGTSSFTISGSSYFSGMTFRAGQGTANNVSFTLDNTDGHIQKYENCTLHLASTNATAALLVGVSSTSVEGQVEFKNTKVIFGAAGQTMRVYVKFRWDGGELASGTAAVTTLISNGSMGIDAVISGVDLSRGASTMNLIGTNFGQHGKVIFRNCKLPASWTGKLIATSPLAGSRVTMHNCSSGSTMYPMWEETIAGKLVHEATVVKTGGANDGAAYSWKITSTTSASYPVVPFTTSELPAKWISTVGSQVTVSVDVLADNAVGLTNEEIWLEVQYPGSTDAKTDFVSSAKASFTTAAATVPSSTATWTTTGVTNPQKQKLTVTFTPQRAGFIHGKVCVAKPSATVYVDPKFILG